MKFFSWMLGTSYQGTNYTLVSSNKDAPYVESGANALEKDNESLLNHMLDSLLTIGTLGHDNPQLLSPKREEEQNTDAADEPEVEVQAERKASPVAESVQPPANKLPTHITPQPIVVEHIQMDPFQEHNRPSVEIIEPLLIIGAHTGQRTTLADLFAVDAEDISSANAHTKKNQASVEAKTSKKVLMNAENSPKLQQPAIKKNVQRVARHLSPIHKLFTNILKKKIHPDSVQLGTRAIEAREDDEQGGLLPKVIRENGSCAKYVARRQLWMAERDQHSSKVLEAVF